MKSALLICLTVSIIFTSSSFGEQLQCNYITHSDGYNCEMASTYEENKEISSVTGDHKFGKSNNDVEVFYVTDLNKSKFVPTKVCSVLQNINKFDVYGGTVVELKKNVFGGCKNLKKIVLKYLKLKTLDEDIFSEVPTLESVTISFTAIEVLPTKLFEKNEKLTDVDCSFNNFKVITTSFPNSLQTLSLMSNDCVDGYYDKRMLSSQTSLTSLIQEAYRKCKAGSSTSAPTTGTVETRMIEQQISANEDKLLEIETAIENLDQRLTNKFEDAEKDVKILKQDVKDKTNELDKRLNSMDQNINSHIENYFKTINQLSETSRSLKVKLEKNEEFGLEGKNLQSLVQRNENFLTVLFCIQLVMVIAIAIYFGYQKFLSNGNFGTRFNESINPSY